MLEVDGARDGVPVGDGERVGVLEGDGVLDWVLVGDCVRERLPEGDGVREGEPLGDGEVDGTVQLVASPDHAPVTLLHSRTLLAGTCPAGHVYLTANGAPEPSAAEEMTVAAAPTGGCGCTHAAQPEPLNAPHPVAGSQVALTATPVP